MVQQALAKMQVIYTYQSETSVEDSKISIRTSQKDKNLRIGAHVDEC